MKYALFVFLWGFISTQVFAAEIKLKMGNGLVANAAYVRGESDKPAVFLLHGFLQTHNFSTVSRLMDGLSGDGYTVLSPTMTLGIPDRKKSLACEALHDHLLDNDFEEISTWLKWLKDKGHKDIVLIGHSQGSTTLLAYLLKNKSQEISRFVAVSIIEVVMSRSATENARLVTLLEKKVAKKSRKPFTSSLSFCVKYLGTPASFLSYQRWSTDKILASIKSLDVPIKIIMGGSDNRLRTDWISELKQTGKLVTVIGGANHFLDGFNEFQLLEVVLDELEK